MARPTTKEDLVEVATAQYNKLKELLATMSSGQKEADFIFDVSTEKGAHWVRDKNVRDVLIHLYEWHQLVINWIDNNVTGNPQPFLPAPYNWRSYGEMNIKFVEKHQNTSEQEAEALLNKSHEEIMAKISTFSNDELFSKGGLTWTGGSTLGAYCVSSTSSHYDWAIKKLKKCIKMNKL